MLVLRYGNLIKSTLHHPLPKLCKFLAISFDSGRLRA